MYAAAYLPIKIAIIIMINFYFKKVWVKTERVGREQLQWSDCTTVVSTTWADLRQTRWSCMLLSAGLSRHSGHSPGVPCPVCPVAGGTVVTSDQCPGWSRRKQLPRASQTDQTWSCRSQSRRQQKYLEINKKYLDTNKSINNLVKLCDIFNTLSLTTRAFYSK